MRGGFHTALTAKRNNVLVGAGQSTLTGDVDGRGPNGGPNPATKPGLARTAMDGAGAEREGQGDHESRSRRRLIAFGTKRSLPTEAEARSAIRWPGSLVALTMSAWTGCSTALGGIQRRYSHPRSSRCLLLMHSSMGVIPPPCANGIHHELSDTGLARATLTTPIAGPRRNGHRPPCSPLATRPAPSLSCACWRLLRNLCVAVAFVGCAKDHHVWPLDLVCSGGWHAR